MNTSPSLQRKINSLYFCFISFMYNKYGNFESFGDVQKHFLFMVSTFYYNCVTIQNQYKMLMNYLSLWCITWFNS